MVLLEYGKLLVVAFDLDLVVGSVVASLVHQVLLPLIPVFVHPFFASIVGASASIHRTTLVPNDSAALFAMALAFSFAQFVSFSLLVLVVVVW